MIIDEILDRKDAEDAGDEYEWTIDNLQYIRDQAEYFGFDDVVKAIDGGREKDIRRALCQYIDTEGYNAKIKQYVKSKKWGIKAA